MIKITLKNGFYFRGFILAEDENSIKIKDIKDKIVEISKDQIAIREEDDAREQS